MALHTLVEHVQTHFADFRGLLPSQGDGPTIRPPLPPWLPPTEAESLLPADHPSPWIIDAEVEPPAPPSGIDDWGADVLAFYLPFHFYNDTWGIYLLASGVLYLACFIKAAPKLPVEEVIDRLVGGRCAPLKPGDERFLRLAELVLREHEAFHFASELAASRSELIAKTRVYGPYFSNRSAAPHEEALANAQALTHGAKKQTDALRNRLRYWMKGQGPGYRDFDQWISAWAFSKGLSQATDFMINPFPPPPASPALGGILFRSSRGYSIPTWMVDNLTRGAAGILRPFPKDFGMQVFVHSNDHPPPHIHIARPPGSRKTLRYKWPELVPLKDEPCLPGPGEKSLRQYVAVYRDQIEAKIRAVYGNR